MPADRNVGCGIIWKDYHIDFHVPGLCKLLWEFVKFVALLIPDGTFLSP